MSSTAFFTEYPEFLSDLVVMAGGDGKAQKAFGAIIDSVGFLQHVSGPTHCHSHTLDLVLSHGINIVDLNIFPWSIGPL